MIEPYSDFTTQKIDQVSNRIYPTAPDESSNIPLTDNILATIKKARVHEFLNEKKKLEDLLVHYKKIKNRWTKADSTIKIFGLTVGGITAVSASVIGGISTLGIGLLPIILGSVFGGISAIDLFLTGYIRQ